MRRVAIFTDVHGLIEPLEAILKDIKDRGIKEIYSLGDNIGTGPSPNLVIDMLKENNVVSVAGNQEYYITIGVSPFLNYFNKGKIDNRNWIYKELSKENLEYVNSLPSSIDLTIGSKKIALCHFANDTRIDYILHSTWTYQDEIKLGGKAYLQFNYTNSSEQKKDIIKNKDNKKAFYDGFRSSYKDPLFNGKSPFEYDYVFQGHVHFKSKVISPTTIFYTVGMAYYKNNMATYIILEENNNDILIKEVYVTFNREKLLDRVRKSDLPDKALINKFLRW